MHPMMNPEKIYTSTGHKLLFHPDALWRFRESRRATPISLQVAPTSRCNLRCSFCSNVNRTAHEDLPQDQLQGLLCDLVDVGLKAVEWTGGGDPTMYLALNDMIRFTHGLGLEQGLITNGVALKANVEPEALALLKWVRISMNCLDYVDEIDIPSKSIVGTLGFSYVYHDQTKHEVFKKIRHYAAEHNVAYVRVVPNCLATNEVQEHNNEILGDFVSQIGRPFFYQAKHFHQPAQCWWCLFKPFLLHDGWVYPCSSVVLNDTADRQFHAKFRMCHMDALPRLYDKQAESMPTVNCTHCVFYPQNQMLEDLCQPAGMENFI